MACKNKKYTLLNLYGKQLFAGPIADDIYMKIEGNEKKYIISANNNIYDAIEFLKSLGISVRENKNTSDENDTTPKKNQQNNEENNNQEKNTENKVNEDDLKNNKDNFIEDNNE